MRGRAGFTLMEVLAVLLVVGIVAGTGMPRLNTGLAQSRLQRAAAVVSSDLRLAHSLAERQRAPVTVAVDGSTGIVRVRDAATATTVFSERRLSGKNGFGVSTVTSSAATITVFPNGLASSELKITLGAAGKQRVVTMTRGGLVTVTTS